METYDDLKNAAITEGGIDATTGGVSEATVGERVNDKYAEMVVRARWRKAEVNLAATVVDQAEYSIADTSIRDIEKLRVEDTNYQRVGQEDLWEFRSGERYARNVFAPDYTSGGLDQIELYPAPEDAGDTIYALAVLSPPPLSSDSDQTILPSEFNPYIVSGVVAWFLKMVDERLDEAQYHAQEFENGIEMLRRRRNQRFGKGPVQIGVAGYHW